MLGCRPTSVGEAEKLDGVVEKTIVFLLSLFTGLSPSLVIASHWSSAVSGRICCWKPCPRIHDSDLDGCGKRKPCSSHVAMVKVLIRIVRGLGQFVLGTNFLLAMGGDDLPVLPVCLHGCARGQMLMMMIPAVFLREHVISCGWQAIVVGLLYSGSCSLPLAPK